MPNSKTLNDIWTKRTPPQGEEAQWLKERSQNARQAKFRSPLQTD
jgi:hypothetical protein